MSTTLHISPSAIPSTTPRSNTAASSFRFTLDGSDALESHLSDVCSSVREGIHSIIPHSKLDGVLLAGGYGRGEGGVLKTADGDLPYNDMEFYVFIKGSTLLNDRTYRAALHQLGLKLSTTAGLDVEFKILSLAALRRSPVTMFSYDYVTRHHWVIGGDALLKDCAHHRQAAAIPAHEATRLLFNRCSGLLFAMERLRRAEFTAEDADFTGRNLAKAQLGMGDAVLAHAGQYHYSCQKRHTLLRNLPSTGHLPPTQLARLVVHHEAGVRFKLHPYRASLSREQLTAQFKELSSLALDVWLHLESSRLGQPFSSAGDYALSCCDKCPEQPSWRNLLVNARAFGFSSLCQADAPRYPRERLFRALALLLWTNRAEPFIELLLQRTLRTTATDFTGFVGAYEKLWHHFN